MYDTIIVGAGLAGLQAATTLSAAGKDIVVLEARDRVGGRVENIALKDGRIVEMGGQWVSPCLLYTSPSPRDQRGSRMPSSA